MGSDPPEHRSEHSFGSERVIKMLRTLPKYYQRYSKHWSLSEAVLTDAVESVFDTPYPNNIPCVKRFTHIPHLSAAN